MNTFSGSEELISLNTTSQIDKVEDFMALIEQVVSKIYTVDENIALLVGAGISGSAVAKVAQDYLADREAIEGMIKSFATASYVLQTNAETAKSIDQKAAEMA